MDLPRGRDNPSTRRRPLSHIALFYGNKPSRNSPNSKASLTSFARTQHYKSAQEGSNASGRLDHEKSRLAIRELLDLRRQTMKSASGRGDPAELFRLQNLNVFEGLECAQRADAGDDSLTMAGYGDNEGEAVTEARNIDTFSHTSQNRSNRAKLDDGASNELETANGGSESPELETSQSDSDGSSTIKATKAQSTESLGRESPTINASATESKLRTPKHSPLRDVPIDLLTQHQQLWRSSSSLRKASRWQCRCRSPSCKDSDTCPRKTGAHGVCLPRPHPKILAAIQRIQSFQESPITIQLSRDLGVVAMYSSHSHEGAASVKAVNERIAAASASFVVRHMHLDMVLVDLYTTEMKRRCLKGVWWEGWLVVEDLRRRGVVGSVTSANVC